MRTLFIEVLECRTSASDIEEKIQSFYDFMSNNYPNFRVVCTSFTECNRYTMYILITYTK